MKRGAGVVAVLVSLMFGLNAALAAAAEPERARKVLILGIDGCRPDAMAKARTPSLDALKRDAAWGDKVQILGERYQGNDTISGPGWSSILTGVWADKHGVQDNEFKGNRLEAFPHFFSRLKRRNADARTVSLTAWPPIDEFIVSDADVRKIEEFAPSRKTVDLNVSADPLGIKTRDGKRHHLLATRSGGKVRLFLDGKLAGTASDTAGEYDLGGADYYLGRDTRTGPTRLKGRLDNVRLWSRGVSAEEAQALAKGTRPGSASGVANRGLLASFDFETADGKPVAEGPWSAAVDDTAGSPGGPFQAAPVTGSLPDIVRDATVPVQPPLDSNHAASFEEDGRNPAARIALKDPLRKLTQGGFSVEAWFKTENKDRNILCGNFADGVGALNIELHTDNRVRVYLQPEGAAANGLAQEADRDRTMAANAARILSEDDPTAMFVYFHQVDATGHTLGFSPDVPEYVQAISNVDSCIAEVLKALRGRKSYTRENWLVIVCTDHGGIRKTHGGGHKIPEIREVFLIVSGSDVEKGKIKGPAYLVDVAATALTFLTGPIDPKWEFDGRPVGLKEIGR